MSKIADYLQEHLRGEVISNSLVDEAFSRDGSIFTLAPEMIVHPYNLSDVRKLARFTWQLAEKGHVLPVTARGGGTDVTGAAIGKGAIVSLPAHMNTILEFDTKQKLVRVQPGLSVRALQTTMMTHGFHIPVFADVPGQMTVGGAIANNYAGKNAHKYGTTRDWIDQLEMVLANGEVIQTGRIQKRELEKRKGLPTLEGEIYRQVDGVIVDNPELIKELSGTMSNVGYALDQVKQRDGSFDLLPLVAGSQGTLGIMSEVILRVVPYTPQAALVMAAFATITEAHDALDEIRKLDPSKVTMLDAIALDSMGRHQMPRLVELLGESFDRPAALFFIEFDDKHAAKKAKKMEKQFSRVSMATLRVEDYEQRMALWQVYDGAVALFKTMEKDKRIGLPLIHDVAIANDQFQTFLEGVAALSKKYRASWPVWGSPVDGRFSVVPSFDLQRASERQKALVLLDEYTTMVTELGGVVAANSGEGRLFTMVSAKQYSAELTELFGQIRATFDPHGTLNPGVKQPNTIKQLLSLVSGKYSGMPLL